MQYSTFLNLWSLVLGSRKSLPLSVTKAILPHFSDSIPAVPFSWNISPYICSVISYFFLFLVTKYLRRSNFRNKCFLSSHSSRAFCLSERRRPGISCLHGGWVCSQDSSHPHTSAWQSRDPRNRCMDVLWLSWPAPNNPLPRGHTSQRFTTFPSQRVTESSDKWACGT